MKRSITTKTGDDGTTRLFSGEEVQKDSPRTTAFGDVDELGSLLGVARAHAQHPGISSALVEIQRSLFTVAAELATTEEHVNKLAQRVDDGMLRELDQCREAVEEEIQMPDGFVIPGGTIGAAHIDHARTVARRCERQIVGLIRDGHIQNMNVLILFNRLSDYLWLLARREEGDAVLPKDEK